MNKRPKVSSNTVKRLLSYIFHYKLRFFFVLVCILVSALTSVASSLYLQTLIDSYITPLLLEANPVFDALLKSIITMACIYVVGVICTFLYNRIMVSIAQGVLKEIRDTMFSHMQTLPIRYFDTHTHGDIMSHYTNDTDTLRHDDLSEYSSDVFISDYCYFRLLCYAVRQCMADSGHRYLHYFYFEYH